MEKKERISFVTNATTREAAVYVMLFAWVMVRNMARAVNRAVHKLPWVFLLIVGAGMFVWSFLAIAEARAERDQYNQKLVNLTRQLDSYKAVYGEGKEAKR